MRKEMTMIPVTKRFREELRLAGQKGETYEFILRRMIGGEGDARMERKKGANRN